jgi:hypothetical protein
VLEAYGMGGGGEGRRKRRRGGGSKAGEGRRLFERFGWSPVEVMQNVTILHCFSKMVKVLRVSSTSFVSHAS